VDLDLGAGFSHLKLMTKTKAQAIKTKIRGLNTKTKILRIES